MKMSIAIFVKALAGMEHSIWQGLKRLNFVRNARGSED